MILEVTKYLDTYNCIVNSGEESNQIYVLSSFLRSVSLGYSDIHVILEIRSTIAVSQCDTMHFPIQNHLYFVRFPMAI
jgi:hypothetical protein